MGKWPDGETALREQRRKAHAGVGDGTVAAGQVWSPLFYGGERKGEQLLSKKGENVFAGGEKSGMTPFPRGGNRAKIGGKTEMRETFL